MIAEDRDDVRPSGSPLVVLHEAHEPLESGFRRLGAPDEFIQDAILLETGWIRERREELARVGELLAPMRGVVLEKINVSVEGGLQLLQPAP